MFFLCGVDFLNLNLYLVSFFNFLKRIIILFVVSILYVLLVLGIKMKVLIKYFNIVEEKIILIFRNIKSFIYGISKY